MKVKFEIELDLTQIIKNSSQSYLLKDQTEEEIIDSMREIFGSDLEGGIKKEMVNSFEDQFEDYFNY
tara:strand:+ start:354 stop:554 length:201 start_codon:yes stop_codon:yes gene_type:complete